MSDSGERVRRVLDNLNSEKAPGSAGEDDGSSSRFQRSEREPFEPPPPKISKLSRIFKRPRQKENSDNASTPPNPLQIETDGKGKTKATTEVPAVKLKECKIVLDRLADNPSVKNTLPIAPPIKSQILTANDEPSVSRKEESSKVISSDPQPSTSSGSRPVYNPVFSWRGIGKKKGTPVNPKPDANVPTPKRNYKRNEKGEEETKRIMIEDKEIKYEGYIPAGLDSSMITKITFETQDGPKEVPIQLTRLGYKRHRGKSKETEEHVQPNSDRHKSLDQHFKDIELRAKTLKLKIDEKHPVQRSLEKLKVLLPGSQRKTWNPPAYNGFLKKVFDRLLEESGYTGNKKDFETSPEYEGEIKKIIKHFKSNIGIKRYSLYEIKHKDNLGFIYFWWYEDTLYTGSGITASKILCEKVPLNSSRKCLQCWGSVRRTQICDMCVAVYYKVKTERPRRSGVPVQFVEKDEEEVVREPEEPESSGGMSVSMAPVLASTSPECEVPRFHNYWYSGDIRIEDITNTSDKPPMEASGLALIGNYLKKHLNFNGSLAEMVETDTFKNEMTRWEEEARKTIGEKKFRPLNIPVSGKEGEKTFFNLRWTGSTINYGVGQSKAEGPDLRNIKCEIPMCWFSSHRGIHCWVHSTQVQQVFIIKDTLNGEEDVFAVVDLVGSEGFTRALTKGCIEYTVGKSAIDYFTSTTEPINFQPLGKPISSPYNKPAAGRKFLQTTKLAVSLAVTLKNQGLLEGINSKHSTFLQISIVMEDVDYSFLRKLLELWGITFGVGEQSELGETTKSPFEHENFCPKLPLVYLAFKAKGQLYDGLRKTPCSGSKFHSDGHERALNKNRLASTSLGKGITDFSLLRSIPAYQMKINKREFDIGNGIPISDWGRGLTEEQKALKDRVGEDAKRVETLSMISTILCVMLGQKIDGVPIQIVETKISFQVNDCKVGDKYIIEGLFAFKCGKELLIKIDPSGQIHVPDNISELASAN